MKAILRLGLSVFLLFLSQISVYAEKGIWDDFDKMFPEISGGAPNSGGYICEVNTELVLRVDGSLSPYQQPRNIGESFSVSKSSGELIGANSSWWFIVGSKATVTSEGSDTGNYISTYLESSNDDSVILSVLYIGVFVEGESKPFQLVTNNVVYAGLCK
jgi:hypothetical protein